MIRVGITGGIGSGKTLVCKVLEQLGVPVYNADTAARNIMESDEEIRHDLTRLLGNGIYTGMSLNRTLVSSLIFGNEELLKALNGIVHPRVALHFEAWCNQQSGAPYVAEESAILFESGIWQRFDKILLVTATEEVRFSRALQRPGMTMEKIRAVVKNQLPESEKIVRSHVVIHNDGKALILPDILRLHDSMINQNLSFTSK
jgi:dephospho-CoA kinase